MFGEYDLEAKKILDDFLPERIFDAHAHLCDASEFEGVARQDGKMPERYYNITDYRRDMSGIFGDRELFLNFFLMPGYNKNVFNRAAEAAFLRDQLTRFPGNSGEITVLPGDDDEIIEKQLVHPGIRGLKCYHTYLNRADSFDAAIDEYLPESAWRVADRHGLCITLHMVRQRALADPVNLNYIKTMAERYPNAILILAHAARAFAAWTGVETIGELQGYDNIRYDVAAVCESPAIFTILQKIGVSRLMWGSDYPIVLSQGKAISLADGFYWIYPRDLANFSGAVHSWAITTENLMATRQACMMAGLGRSDVERIFYKNAAELFHVDG